ncbi:ABC transporter permease subunit [Streptomyces alkaliphilus]|uniref:ABC transporter permease subunit n=1 Tax=Streptomyces alkaliphilus TaxID=1472722 RepID=A0A7W3Y312_9ACTN|nr:ABC transporter permease subunit [Streptomyces alkaliphilus]MBB0246339.1 ABC transporter permease subunit [Streptomyces alkaliphilus]
MTTTPLPGPAAPAARPARPRRTTAVGGWLGALPLLLFTGLCFGVPLIALLTGAFTTTDPVTGTTVATTDHLTRSLRGHYLDALLGSLRLSLITAAIGAVAGTLLARAIVTSRSRILRDLTLTASGVLANFGGVPLAFAFIATLGISGVVTRMGDLGARGWSLYTFSGLVLVYLYFLIPLMVLVTLPALDGLRPQWREAALDSGAGTLRYWWHIGLPILTPALLGGFVLLFGTAFAAHATAAALVGSGGMLPLVTLKIADALGGNVLIGQEGVALALALDMIAVAAVVMAVYLPLQRRSARWLR